MMRESLYHSPKLVVRRSAIHRWGVFALAPIEAYELLEEAPYFVAPREELAALPSCNAYSYDLSDDELIIGMGFAGLYNHSTQPNVEFEIDKVNQAMRHYAVRRVEAGEELTLDYGEDNAAAFPTACAADRLSRS
jgi:SET domain-containing protein